MKFTLQIEKLLYIQHNLIKHSTDFFHNKQALLRCKFLPIFICVTNLLLKEIEGQYRWTETWHRHFRAAQYNKTLDTTAKLG